MFDEYLVNQISGYFLGLILYISAPKDSYKNYLEKKKKEIIERYKVLKPVVEQEISGLYYNGAELLADTIKQIEEMDLEEILNSERKEELKKQFEEKEKLFRFIYQKLRDNYPDNPNVWY